MNLSMERLVEALEAIKTSSVMPGVTVALGGNYANYTNPAHQVMVASLLARYSDFNFTFGDSMAEQQIADMLHNNLPGMIAEATINAFK